MDRKAVIMVKSLLEEIIGDKERRNANWAYHASADGKEIIEQKFCRQYCLSKTPEVRQAIFEFLSS